MDINEFAKKLNDKEYGSIIRDLNGGLNKECTITALNGVSIEIITDVY